MRKILGIIGSPRKKGNTDILVNKILDGAKEEGAVVENLFLNDLNIKECDGCHACWKTDICCKKDDMNNIYPKIIESDVIVFGTPVYWYGPSALMKMFIDRFVYFNSPENKLKIKGKGAVIVIPFEEEDPDTVAPLMAFFDKSLQYLGMNLLGKIIVPGVTLRGEISKKDNFLTEAFDLGKILVK